MSDPKPGCSRKGSLYRCPCTDQSKLRTAAAVLSALTEVEGHACDWIDSVEKKICKAIGVDPADVTAFVLEDQRQRAAEQQAKRIRKQARAPVAIEALPESLRPLWLRFMAAWSVTSKTILAAEADEEPMRVESFEPSWDPAEWVPCLKQADSAQTWARGLIQGLPWANEVGLRYRIERATLTLERYAEMAGLNGA